MTATSLDDLMACDAVELASMVASGHVSPVEIVQASLERLERLEPALNAFSHVLRTEALDAARLAERQRADGSPLPPLFGVPFSVKDLIAVEGAPLAFGCRAFADNRAAIDAPSVARLRAAGAIVIGKTTTSEMGCKAVGASPLTGFTRSPWDPACTAGGSSAGAAASVAAGVTPVALGTDGGGSIRIPAALNGLVGFKAQFGRVPVFPHSATPELAHVAPLARSVRDIALMLQVISGHDARDPGSLMQAPPNFLRAADTVPRKVRIAWSPTYGYARPEAEVVDVVEAAVRALERGGCEVDLVEAPFGPDPGDAWTQLFYAQVATRYGDLLESRPDLIDPAVLPLLHETATRPALVHARALAARRQVYDQLRVLFERFDVLISPTLPVASVPVGLDVPPGQEGRNLVTWASYTYPFNLTGLPAASLPAGRTAAGHPVGLQAVGRPGGDAELLNFCAALEALRPWPRVAPLPT